jgi:CheY-like chemotaxis protein
MRVAGNSDMNSIPVVLCIDDFKPGLVTRKAFLEQFGFKVLIASSGAEGLEIIKVQHINVVILDYRMPEMNGQELAAKIRQMSVTIPLLLLSGFVSDIPEALKKMVDIYLTKGDPPGMLVSALSQLTATTTEQRKAAQKKGKPIAGSLEQFKRKAV